GSLRGEAGKTAITSKRTCTESNSVRRHSPAAALNPESRWSDGLHGHAAVDNPSREGRESAANHRGGGLGPRDRRYSSARSGEEGTGAPLRKHQGLPKRPLHKAVHERACRSLSSRPCPRLSRPHLQPRTSSARHLRRTARRFRLSWSRQDL